MVGVIGGVSITLFSLLQVRSLMKRKVVADADAGNKNYFLKTNKERKGPFILGIVFSALNPFFLICWSTVGLKLISDSIFLFGLIFGILFTFLFHIWMDYAWLTVTSYMMSKGILILKATFYNILLLVLSIALASYGLYLIMVNIADT